MNLEDHRIELRGIRLAEAFLDCLIRLSHFSKGCEQGGVEEACAYRFATALVEFALRIPHTWRWPVWIVGLPTRAPPLRS